MREKFKRFWDPANPDLLRLVIIFVLTGLLLAGFLLFGHSGDGGSVLPAWAQTEHTEPPDERLAAAQKENRKTQLCHRHFYVDEYMELMATNAKRDRLKRMQTREPYKYTRKIVLKLSKSDKRSREREVLKKMSQTYTAHEIITYQKWYEWREKARKLLPLKAEYFNQCLRRYRNKALSRGEKFSKVRPLKPCLDLNHEVYYRSKRDKYIPLEVFNHTFNPFPNVHYPRRYCYPEAPKPSVQTIP